MKFVRLIILFLAPVALFLAGCSFAQGSPTNQSVPSPLPEKAAPATAPAPTATFTPLPPTPTPEPLAATINGEGITLAEFQAEFARYQASGTNLATNSGMSPERYVLNQMIQETLLAQGAVQAGFTLDAAALQQRVDQLAGRVNLPDWLNANGYTEVSFRQALSRSTSAAWMRDQIANKVPTAGEQIHVLQILLYNSDDANQVYSLLQNGQDFLTLARRYDPTTGGELGWITHGTLNDAALEEAAFNLQPGSYSTVIKTSVGYHILFVQERDPQRIFESQTYLLLQERALEAWLTDRQNSSRIEIMIP